MSRKTLSARHLLEYSEQQNVVSTFRKILIFLLVHFLFVFALPWPIGNAEGMRFDIQQLQSWFFLLTTILSFAGTCANRKYLRENRISITCDRDLDCVDFAFCREDESNCYCFDGFIPIRNRSRYRCLPVVWDIGGFCEENLQCQIKFGNLAECRENTCQCSPTSHFVDNRCHKTVGLGEICNTSSNCYVKDSPSYCMLHRCVCPFHFHPSLDRTRCIRNGALGDNCTNGEECIVSNSRCINTCVCNIDHVESSDRRSCLKAANAIGEECQEDSQCQEFLKNAACCNGKCDCVKEYHLRGSFCFKSVKLKERCTRHEECVTTSLEDSNSTSAASVDCVNGVCTCAKNYVSPNGDPLDCVPVINNGVAARRLIATCIIAHAVILWTL